MPSPHKSISLDNPPAAIWEANTWESTNSSCKKSKSEESNSYVNQVFSDPKTEIGALSVVMQRRWCRHHVNIGAGVEGESPFATTLTTSAAIQVGPVLSPLCECAIEA